MRSATIGIAGAVRVARMLRAFVRAGLRNFLDSRRRGREVRFRLRDATIDGRGLQPEVRTAERDRIRGAT